MQILTPSGFIPLKNMKKNDLILNHKYEQISLKAIDKFDEATLVTFSDNTKLICCHEQRWLVSLPYIRDCPKAMTTKEIQSLIDYYPRHKIPMVFDTSNINQIYDIMNKFGYSEPDGSYLCFSPNENEQANIANLFRSSGATVEILKTKKGGKNPFRCKIFSPFIPFTDENKLKRLEKACKRKRIPDRRIVSVSDLKEDSYLIYVEKSETIVLNNYTVCLGEHD